MKPLTASKIIQDRKQELININNLFDLPNRQDKDYLDYLDTMYKDLDKNGMMYPIFVIKKENYWNRLPWHGDDDKMGVVTGSNRFRYAIERGYTHIESIVVKSRDDWFPLWQKTFLRVKRGLTDNS